MKRTGSSECRTLSTRAMESYHRISIAPRGYSLKASNNPLVPHNIRLTMKQLGMLPSHACHNIFRYHRQNDADHIISHEKEKFLKKLVLEHSGLEYYLPRLLRSMAALRITPDQVRASAAWGVVYVIAVVQPRYIFKMVLCTYGGVTAGKWILAVLSMAATVNNLAC